MLLSYQADSDRIGFVAAESGRRNEISALQFFAKFLHGSGYDWPGSKAAIWLACCAIGESGKSVLIWL